jgi:hypothetical protein
MRASIERSAPMTWVRGAILVIATMLIQTAPGRAADDNELPVVVGVVARVLDVSRIQEVAGEMAATIELTMRWSDRQLAFDPVKEGRGVKEFFGRPALAELEKIWNPSVTVRNMIGSARVDETGLLITAGGQATLVRTIDSTFRLSIDMGDFPFDRAALPIELISTRYDGAHLALVHRAQDEAASTVTQNPRVAGWRLRGLSFENGSFTAWNAEQRGVLTVFINATRKSGPYAARIFIPFFMIMMSSLFVLWTPDTNFFSKGTMIFSSLLALVALSFTFENSFPGSISLQTPVSTIVTSGYVYLVGALMLNILAMNPDMAWAKHHPFVANEVRSVIKWAVPSITLVIWAALILQAAL